MAFLVRWTGPDGDKAETVATAKAAIALYVEAIEKNTRGLQSMTKLAGH
jgi:hypothetical protein